MQVIVDRGRDPDDAKPACMERVRPGLRPVPPADDQASTRWCASASRSRRCPASSLNSGHRALRRMVPPSWMMPPTSRWRPGPPGRTDGCRRPSTSCAHVVVRDAGFRASRPTWCPAAPAGAVPRMMYRRVNGGHAWCAGSSPLACACCRNSLPYLALRRWAHGAIHSACDDVLDAISATP